MLLQSDLSKSLAMENIDSASGVLFPFWDDGTNMVYLVGKVCMWNAGLQLCSRKVVYLVKCVFVQGDTQIRYFEVTTDSVFFLNMYQSTVPGRSVCAMPKKEMEYMKCEVMRFFKLQHTKSLVEPIAMTVPRKVSQSLLQGDWSPHGVRLWLQSDMFQADIFPPCPSGEPALTAEEWIGGVDKDPKLMSFGGDGQTVTSSAPKVSVSPAAIAPDHR